MENKYIETHFHFDYLKAFSQEEILKKAREIGVDKFVTIAVEPDNLKSVRELAAKYEDVYFTQGVHPHDSRLLTEDSFQEISEHAHDEKCVAIGEIGLDYHYDNSPRDIQREVFEKQLELAIEKDLPVVIHTRDADEHMMEALKKYSPRMNRKGVVHSFSSGLELAKLALDEGFYLGFNGMITFKKADDVREAVKLAPINQIVIETDAPFLTPVPHRGKENGPYYLNHIADKICEIKNLSPEEAIPTIYENSLKLFW